MKAKYLILPLFIALISTSNAKPQSKSELKRVVAFEQYKAREGYPTVEITPVIVENSANRIDLKAFGAKADGKHNDGELMQRAIEQLAKDPNGGVLYLPKADYMLNSIKLLSNVHIHIEAGSKIRMPLDTEQRGLFALGNDEFVNNVVVRGVNGRFTIDISDRTDRARVFTVKLVHNFMISDFDLYDNKISFPIITMGAGKSKDVEIFGPTNGVIKNATAYNSHYGYGLVQAQAARKVYFENLHGVGGATLRFETGEIKMNNAQFGGVFDVVCRNISNENGNSAVMISPHMMQCGIVQVEGVKAKSSGFAARIDGGYQDKGVTNPNAKPGTYAKGSYVADVTGEFGTTAQVKKKHFAYIPTALRPTGEATGRKGLYDVCPSVACVLTRDLNYEIGVYDVKATGYSVPDIVSEPYK